MSQGGLPAWRRLIDSELTLRRQSLARARQVVATLEQLEAALLAERARRDKEELALRQEGDLPSFAREKTAVLLDQAILRAKDRTGSAKLAESRALDAVRGAKTRRTAIDRVLDRRRNREQFEAQRAEQKVIDEVATRRAGAPPAEERP
jgi:hypothetical protein